MCTKLLRGKPKTVISAMIRSIANCPQSVMQRARDLVTWSLARSSDYGRQKGLSASRKASSRETPMSFRR